MAKQKFEFKPDSFVRVKAVNRYNQLQSQGLSLAEAAKIVAAELISEGEELPFDGNSLISWLISCGQTADEAIQIAGIVIYSLAQQPPAAEDMFDYEPDPPAPPPPALDAAEFLAIVRSRKLPHASEEGELLTVDGVGSLMESQMIAEQMFADVSLHPTALDPLPPLFPGVDYFGCG